MNIIRPVVRNISGVSLSQYEREFIMNETVKYRVGGDHPLYVVGYVSNGFYELEARSPVREGYTPQEVIEELSELRTFPNYTDKVWFVCKLSSSCKTVTVLEIHREGR